MEKFINNGEKPKSIIVNGNLHRKLKVHCKGKNMKIGGVVEDLITLYLEDPKEIQKKMDVLLENNAGVKTELISR